MYEYGDDYGLGWDEDLGEGSFFAEDLCPDYFGLDEALKKVDLGPRLINFQDYTLNSPLIPDDLEHFLEGLQQPTNSKIEEKSIWGRRRDLIKEAKINPQNVLPIRKFHEVVAKIFQSKSICSASFKKLLVNTDQYSEQTFRVAQAFMNTWLKTPTIFQSRLHNGSDILKYGSLMLDLLTTTWLLNAATNVELLNLMANNQISFLKPLTTEKQIKKVKKKKELLSVVFNSETLGKIVIGCGICYFVKHRLLLDRNMILMFKDTATARFHTLFAIEHRQMDVYSPNHGKLISAIYDKGDEVLSNHPDIAYDVFSMVEPITSHRLSQLAASYRSTIPEFPHFKDHIQEKTTLLSQNSSVIPEFFKLLLELDDRRVLLTAYGAFRHWGHPFINYMEGLKALYENVTKLTSINVLYAKRLASDLAYKILREEFNKKKTWFVEKDLVPTTHDFYHHIHNNTWPSSPEIMEFTGLWSDLPIRACWDIPEVVDPTIIYSDKSHSINRSELISHMYNSPGKPFPTKRVLNTFLNSPATDWPEFLKQINERGLDLEDLVIGLRAKERELKKKGRFFALMSWKLREYFVFTEYLIKRHVLPLFSSLTMADDQTTVIKKMMENTSGQGKKNYESVTIANHIDYNKWNNFQRGEATNPVFKVIGQFFGYENLFCRTHEFFEKSLIYYRDRPDLMYVNGETLESLSDEKRVCWNGQLGGLEGLRQKGWSVLNLLVIERESKVRSTKVQILAQGDNQVICTKYTIHPHETDVELRNHLEDAVRNNAVIMKRIREATESIGLFINEDETLQSADMLIYGKNIIFRGNVTCLEEKKYSRITCTTNDQLPGLGNVMSTVSTNCLTVSHFSDGPANAIMNYNWLGNFAAEILHIHNPALRDTPFNSIEDQKKKKLLSSFKYRIALLYLDPSLGGICGMSLTRFHIRMFPDPVTEGLAFWKAVYQGTSDPEIQNLAVLFGNPRLLTYHYDHFPKLIEDPASLNLPRGLSINNVLKDEIRDQLIAGLSTIVNDIVKDAVVYVRDQCSAFEAFLDSIQPCFPRFLSEFKAATYLGVTEGIVGLFENSNTIRNVLKEAFSKKIDQIIVQSELNGILQLIRTLDRKEKLTLWQCSATQADVLRELSWDRSIIGTTVPHPLEFLSEVSNNPYDCKGCLKGIPYSAGIVVIVPEGLVDINEHRGPLEPYYGSSTDENTSLLQSWEKSTDLPFIRRASNLRRAFSWFVDPNSPLGKSINGNLYSLTGEDPGTTITGFKRTGSALHRFGCSRVSAGGYLANSPVKGSRMIISSDLFKQLGDDNYDFMYQSLMLYAQQTVGEVHMNNPSPGTYHFHIGCVDCLRKIPDEVELSSSKEFVFSDMSAVLTKWKPAETKWFKEAISLPIEEGDWAGLFNSEKCYEIGKLQGLVFSEFYKENSESSVISNLFPIGIRDRMIGHNYLEGLQDGLMRGAIQAMIHRGLFYRVKTYEVIAKASYDHLLKDLCSFPGFLVFSQGEDINRVLKNFAHRIPPSYPTNSIDLGSNLRCFLQEYNLTKWKAINLPYTKTWIFADFSAASLSGFLIVNHHLVSKTLFSSSNVDLKVRIREVNDLLTAVKENEVKGNLINWCNDKNIRRCNMEVRSAVKETLDKPKQENSFVTNFSYKLLGSYRSIKVQYVNFENHPPSLKIPKIQNPLISAIRYVQLATGSWYKLETILNALKLDVVGALCVGDGSGGISSLVLRKYPRARLIFNSLLDVKNAVLGGSVPKPPAALDQMGDDIKSRCVNLNRASQSPSDLRHNSTWQHFLFLKKLFDLKIELMIMDMEITCKEDIDAIDSHLRSYIGNLLTYDGILIVKTYLERLISPDSILSTLGKSFGSVCLFQTEWSSSHTSEIYVVMQHLIKKDMISSYVNWEVLTPYLERTFCLRTYESEFGRALKMLKITPTVGFPSQFIPNPKTELLNLLITSGGDPTLMTRWMSLVEKSFSQNSPSWAINSLILVSANVIPIGQIFQQKTNLPSDNSLENFFSLYVSCWLYVAVLTGDSDLGYKVNNLINKPFGVRFFWTELMGVARIGLGWKIGWKLDEKGIKRVYLQRKMATIGQILRVLLRMSSKLEDPRSEKAVQQRQHVLQRVQNKDVWDSTDIYNPIQN